MWRVHPIYLSLGKTSAQWQKLYRKLIEDKLDREVIAKIRHCSNSRLVLGSKKIRAQGANVPEEYVSQGGDNNAQVILRQYLFSLRQPGLPELDVLSFSIPAIGSQPFIPDFDFPDFVGRRFWQRVHHPYVTGHHVMRHARNQELHQFPFGDRLPRFRRDRDKQLLVAVLAGHSNHGRFGHLREAQHFRLYFK